MAMKSVAPCCSSQAMIERWYFVSRGSDKTGLFEALYRTRNILAGDAGKGSDTRKAGMGVSRLIHMLSHRNKYPQIERRRVQAESGRWDRSRYRILFNGTKPETGADQDGLSNGLAKQIVERTEDHGAAIVNEMLAIWEQECGDVLRVPAKLGAPMPLCSQSVMKCDDGSR